MPADAMPVSATSRERDARLRRMYDDGASVIELADLFHMNRNDVAGALDMRVVSPNSRLMPSGLERRAHEQPINGCLRAAIARLEAATAQTWCWDDDPA